MTAQWPTHDAGPRQPRKDVQRNRLLLIRTADELISAQGLDVTFHQLAAAAGVGVGTVYRHFDSRDELLDELVVCRLERVGAVLRDAEKEAHGIDALRRAILETCSLQEHDVACWQLLQSHGAAHRQLSDRLITPPLTRLVERARTAGDLRRAITVPDVLMIFWISGALNTYTVGVRPDLWRRYIDSLLDGFLTEGSKESRSTTPPLTPEQLTRLIETRPRL